MSLYNITIVGDKEVINRMQGIANSLGNMTEPLVDFGKYMLDSIDNNMLSRGKTFGHPWKPLAKATIAINKTKGDPYPTQPLIRTGALRKGFEYTQKSMYSAEITNTQSYAELHQKGGYAVFNGKVVKIPQRILVAIDDRRRKRMVDIFRNWVEQVITKSEKATPKKVSIESLQSSYNEEFTPSNDL